jgi:uncharacterized protein (TIGR02588 family)
MTPGSPGGRSLAEWVTFALSLLVVGALIAIALVEESRRQQADGSSVEVTFDGDRALLRDGSFYIPYVVRNTGSEAIASAEIWLDVFEGDVLVDSDEIVVQFLPLQGVQEGVYVTTYDPKTHTFRGRLESLQVP